ncbi:hypothetical protein C9299_10130 [Escherichia coli]|nr:hypothetical protein [Escherichia coli]TFX12199.1 hypothetical protein DEO12_17090 [Escherichia coli]TJB60843.1 hypothetical protein C9299_10130 [Escherichia coli]
MTIFAQYGPLAPLGRGLGCGEKRPPCPHPARTLLRSDLAAIATHSQVDYNNRLSVRTVY